MNSSSVKEAFFGEMSFRFFFSTELLIEVQEGFLTLASIKEKGALATLSCKEIIKFVERLCSAFNLKPFEVPIAGGRLYVDKLVFGEKTIPLSEDAFNCLLQKLIATIPLVLLHDLNTQKYVSASANLVTYLAEQVLLESGKECFNKLKLGVHEKILLDFYQQAEEQSQCDKKTLQNFLFVHVKIFRSVYQLRTLLLKKNPAVVASSSTTLQS
jgi:hypothetical protein